MLYLALETRLGNTLSDFACLHTQSARIKWHAYAVARGERILELAVLALLAIFERADRE